MAEAGAGLTRKARLQVWFFRQLRKLLLWSALTLAGGWLLVKLALYGFDLVFAPGVVEVARIASPVGDCEAVLLEVNGGATTSYGYEVYLTPPHGQPQQPELVATLYAARRSSSAYGVNLRWLASNRLALQFESARTHELVQPAAQVGDHVVRVELQPGVTDPAAPAGSMESHLPHPI